MGHPKLGRGRRRRGFGAVFPRLRSETWGTRQQATATGNLIQTCNLQPATCNCASGVGDAVGAALDGDHAGGHEDLGEAEGHEVGVGEGGDLAG